MFLKLLVTWSAIIQEVLPHTHTHTFSLTVVNPLSSPGRLRAGGAQATLTHSVSRLIDPLRQRASDEVLARIIAGDVVEHTLCLAESKNIVQHNYSRFLQEDTRRSRNEWIEVKQCVFLQTSGHP